MGDIIMKKLILTSLCVLFVSGTAMADWLPGMPAKWEQLPDPCGWDVLATEPKILADDIQQYPLGQYGS